MTTKFIPNTPAAVAPPVAPGGYIGDMDEPKGARTVLWVIMLGLVVLVTWSNFAKVDQVTRAQAQLVVAERTQLIQSADGGIITQLHVKEGASVKEGQLLATLQKERAEAAVSDSQAKVAALRITLTRLKSEVYGVPLKFDPDVLGYSEYIQNQTDLYNKRQKALNDDVGALENILRLADAELSINRQLEASGDVSRADVLRLERSVADVKAQLANRRNKYFQDTQTDMTKAQEELSTQTEQLRDRKQLLEHTELVAPFDGIINNIKVNTIGGVVRPGDTVMELLLTGNQLIAEAKINPSDIAFVAIGQDASVKLDAYDSSIFGAMHGKVDYISPDVLTEETRNGPMMYYRVRIGIIGKEFIGDRGKEIQLRPGLTAQVDIKAMERTVFSYLSKPITKTLHNSLGER